jgi:orotate phosphoribosyltransferase
LLSVIGIAAWSDDAEIAPQVFSVRKSAKIHGRQKVIEGNFSPGNSVVIVDDVITTGGSTLKAIEAVEAAGGQVVFALVLVDRQEGGRENIEKRVYRVIPIFTCADLIDTDAEQRSSLGGSR